MLEIDHVFICTADNIQVVDRLTEFGLNLSPKQIHQGQGTANRCIFFDNAYLELLLKDSNRDLQSKPVKAISLWERMQWQDTNASPFGVSFRFTEKQNIPVATRPYDAPFLPDGITIPVATPQDSIHEPLIFFSLVSQAPIKQNLFDRSLLEHKGSQHKITGLKITIPFSKQSEQLQWFCDRDLISIKVGNKHHAELELNKGIQGQNVDFSSVLPLSILW